MSVSSPIHAFVDTNIYIRIATQGRPCCERSHFDDLRTLVRDRAFILLVPEVVLLEVERAFHTLPKELESHCDKLGDAVKKASESVWNEIESLKVHLLEQIKQFKKSKIAEASEIAEEVLAFLQSEHVTQIPLSSEIVVAAKRRQIAGKLPNARKSNDQDALIVESLAFHFGSSGQPKGSFLFCTENTKDFALELSQASLDRRFVLDPSLQETLPLGRFSIRLADMLGIVSGFEALPEPTNDEIEAALEFRDAHEDVDDELFGEAQRRVMEAVHDAARKQFEEEFQPTLPEDVKSLRLRLAKQALELLNACRSCPSWRERSEYKLAQWIEYVDESMIPHTSIPKLVRIKDSLERYLDVHRQMDLDFK